MPNKKTYYYTQSLFVEKKYKNDYHHIIWQFILNFMYHMDTFCSYCNFINTQLIPPITWNEDHEIFKIRENWYDFENKTIVTFE